MDGSRVDLLAPVRILHKHLTKALCERVFEAGRVSERRRVWTLQQIAHFWTAVIIRAPDSLTQALDEAHRGVGGYPHVQATSQAFFERSKGLRWTFFRDLHDAFLERVLVSLRPVFEAGLRKKLTAFTDVFVVDGSGLDAVAHRLKVLWHERLVVLPGSLLVFYDLFRGVPRKVHFYEEAMGSEVGRTEAVLDSIAPGTLIVGDRAYCSVRLFGAVTNRSVFLLARRNRSVKLRERVRVGSERHGEGLLEEFHVLAGAGNNGVEPQRLRLVRWTKGSKVVELLTNVLDQTMLPGTAALDLYRRRWTVERMFYDLKEVLNLRRFYAANVNAVAMQVYASALVYVALRAAQGQIARDIRIRPERISIPKLFPRVAVASHVLAAGQLAFRATQAANPGVELREPDWGTLDFAWSDVASILVEKRNEKRRKRRYCEARRHHTSLHRYCRPRAPR